MSVVGRLIVLEKRCILDGSTHSTIYIHVCDGCVCRLCNAGLRTVRKGSLINVPRRQKSVRSC